MFDVIFLTLGISMIIQAIMFIPAFFFQTDKLTDLSYSITFIILSLILLYSNNITLPKIILILMIITWATRLGSFLFMRIRKIKRDKRFDKMRNSFIKFGGFWVLQGFTVCMIMMSSILFLNSESNIFNNYSIIGIIVWIIGLSIETISDNQKYAFKQDKKNKGKWIESGLWKYSRHPNYFGEILNWIGIYIFTLSNLSGINILIALISPAFISFMLFFISGIPILERNADKKWGKIKSYKEYKENTSILIPWFK